MSECLVLAAALIAGCGHSASNDTQDGGPVDGAVVVDADGPVSDADAGPDADADTAPPSLVTQTPDNGAEAWLHEPVRLVFDEPITPASVAGLAVTATVAGAPVSAKVARESTTTIAISLDATARGVGPLAIHVAGQVSDLAGNELALDRDITLALPAWHSQAVDRGVAAESPAIAVSDGGAVYAAWAVGAAGQRRVAVSMQDGGAWQSLGATLGGGDTSSVAITIIGGDPVVAWIEGGQARAARWDGTWHDLPSPGDGTYVALSGAYVATFGTSAQVAKLVSDVWQPLPALAVPSPIASEPALAADGDRVAVGWIDSGRQLRVYRYMMAWMPIAPIQLTAPPTGADRMSVAIRGATVAVAWDQYMFSYGVLAASTAGTSWTRLGHTLDVDPASDAVAPAIALDTNGAPIVAWTETIQDRQRGIVARWASGKWNIVGGRTFLLADDAQPERPTLALHAGQAPVVGYAADGNIAVQRLNGPKTPDFGIAQRQSIAGCSISATNPPVRLSLTGCFTITPPGKTTPHAGLVPYDINVKLWSDGAEKRRFIGLPDGMGMTLSATDAWAAPNGTFITKEFDIETTVGDPSTRRAIETRFLVKDASGWHGYSYQWRLDGTDADLLNDGEYSYDWPTSAGPHHHIYPSQSQCLSCHESSYGPLLGLRPQQLNRWNDYNGVIADQIPTLANLGVGPATTMTPFISPHDPSETAEHRMRGYMAANCAHCHNPNHIAIKDLRYTTPLSQTRLCEVIVPGSPTQSIVYQKVSSRPGMPPLGTASIDPLAVSTLGTWISGMTSCP